MDETIEYTQRTGQCEYQVDSLVRQDKVKFRRCTKQGTGRVVDDLPFGVLCEEHFMDRMRLLPTSQ